MIIRYLDPQGFSRTDQKSYLLVLSREEGNSCMTHDPYNKFSHVPYKAPVSPRPLHKTKALILSLLKCGPRTWLANRDFSFVEQPNKVTTTGLGHTRSLP